MSGTRLCQRCYQLVWRSLTYVRESNKHPPKQREARTKRQWVTRAIMSGFRLPRGVWSRKNNQEKSKTFWIDAHSVIHWWLRLIHSVKSARKEMLGVRKILSFMRSSVNGFLLICGWKTQPTRKRLRLSLNDTFTQSVSLNLQRICRVWWK